LTGKPECHAAERVLKVINVQTCRYSLYLTATLHIKNSKYQKKRR